MVAFSLQQEPICTTCTLQVAPPFRTFVDEQPDTGVHYGILVMSARLSSAKRQFPRRCSCSVRHLLPSGCCLAAAGRMATSRLANLGRYDRATDEN